MSCHATLSSTAKAVSCNVTVFTTADEYIDFDADGKFIHIFSI